MGKIYGYSTELDQTFKYTQPAPMDDRVAVKYKSDLDLLLPYVGLKTYVASEKLYYYYDGTKWIPEMGTSNGFVVLGIYPDYEEFINAHPSGVEGVAYLIGTPDDNNCWVWDIDHEEWKNIGPLRGKPGIQGQPGPTGADGKSDYEIAKEHGYTGTEGDWVNTYLVTSTVFPIIRKLQAEVARLRNSFLFGINSYEETDTAQSRVVNGYAMPEEEPLWAIDEDDLSKIEDLEVEFNEYHGLHILSGDIDLTTSGVLGIEEAQWQDDYNILRDRTDTKILVYLAASNDTITFYLENQEDENIRTIEIPVRNLTRPAVVDSYHYMFLLSKQINGKGGRYVYMSIDNNKTGLNLARGYYNVETESLQEHPYDLGLDFSLSKIKFQNLNLTKLHFYGKPQDFSNEVLGNSIQEVIPVAPNEEDYKYAAAHLTIRGVKNYTTLSSIKDQLKTHELVWDDNKQELYIKVENGLKKIGATSSGSGNQGTEGGGNTDNDTMTNEEVLEILKSTGIVSDDNGNLHINPVGDITFINTDTNKTFITQVDAYGNLTTVEQTTTTLADSFDEAKTVITGDGIRGLIGRIGEQKYKNLYPSADVTTKNIGLFSDRLKIGALYMPLDTDKIYGCSHCYIELENTSDVDIPLKNCYLHYSFPLKNDEDVYTQEVRHLPLTGTIKAGSTYLIRCASKPVSANTFIYVDTYDQEWYYEGKLLDLTAIKSIVTDVNSPYGYGLALTYYDKSMATLTGKVISTKDITSGTVLCDSATSYYGGFIDALIIGKNWSGGKWAVNTAMPITSNCICKNTFELDPANQAYQGLYEKDSSRVRWKTATDYQNLLLDKPYIEFPDSKEKYPIFYFTPKASFENKNVCTDKTKFDTEKPNMPTVSFGIDIHKTRCFNWLSAGLFDEYVWIRQQGTDTWERFESYGGNDKDKSSSMTKKVWAALTQKQVYDRITATFPGSGQIYTSHKCIVNIVNTAPSSPTIYEYCVGRADKNGNPDVEHTSDILTFTIYPESYTPRIYQITDQQGFHWIEYQAWAAAAIAVNDKIIKDCSEANIIPILINTGDMTQNGTRINEWLDYYNGGKCLFSHLEQMNVVGNNDLCNSVPGVGKNGETIPAHEMLGTGNDDGKSSPYYFHICYCYEIDTSTVTVRYQNDANETEEATIDISPIVNGVYIPSLYYFGNSKYTYLMLNSEMTEAACRNLYKLSDASTGNFYNIYTGCLVDSSARSTWKTTTWTPIYTQLYGILSSKVKGTTCVVCHEMPFTVITQNNVKNSTITSSRGFDSKNGLVGSHLCQIVNGESGDGIYWCGRLLEHFDIKLCIGGHKHTYACSFPVRENYIYNGVASKDVKMKMKPTLETDKNISWIGEANVYSNDETFVTKSGCHLSKLPLLKASAYNINANTDSFLPGVLVPDLTGGIIYFMCQATGYKRQSNKELPTKTQIFSQLIPETNDAASTAAKKVNANQKYAMFAIIKQGTGTFEIELARITGIFDSSKNFTQASYGNGVLGLEFIHPTEDEYGNKIIYGKWEAEKEINNYIVKI